MSEIELEEEEEGEGQVEVSLPSGSGSGSAPSGSQAEIEQGKAIQSQLQFWDSLLEIRIRLQKVLVEANKLPQPQTFASILEQAKGNGYQVPNPRKQLAELLDQLLELNDLLGGEEDVDHKLEKEEEEDEEILSEDEEEEEEELTVDKEEETEEDEEVSPSEKQKSPTRKNLKRKLEVDDYEVESQIKRRFESYKPTRNQIIQKWNDKTQVASGKYNNKKTNYAAFQTSTLKQIEQVLSDRPRLIRRTQLKRSEYDIIGKEKKSTEEEEPSPETGTEHDPEIFDDDDFYHQLLRELIERKASNLTNPIELSRHWLELQKLRSKTKRKVDTKASKARKIRYEVFPKLVNFMAPLDETPMTAHGIKELFNSLFGNTMKASKLT